MIGSSTWVAIGLLHTWVHLSDMRSDELKAEFDRIPPLDGTDIWHLWNGLSLLMGFGFIALGLANIAGLRSLPKHAYPNVGTCIINMAALASITFIGILHLGPMQTFGGPVGIALFGLPVLWSTLDRRRGITDDGVIAAPVSGRAGC